MISINDILEQLKNGKNATVVFTEKSDILNFVEQTYKALDIADDMTLSVTGDYWAYVRKSIDNLPSTNTISSEDDLKRFAMALNRLLPKKAPSKSHKEPAPTRVIPIVDKYKTRPAAENFLNGVATAILVVGWILAIAMVAAGYFVYETFLPYTTPQNLVILASVILGGLILFCFFVMWAKLKVLLNISRNLYNINDKLKKLHF